MVMTMMAMIQYITVHHHDINDREGRNRRICLGLCLLWMSFMSASGGIKYPVMVLNKYEPTVGCPSDGVDRISVIGTVDMTGVDEALFPEKVSLTHSVTETMETLIFINCAVKRNKFFYCTTKVGNIYTIVFSKNAVKEFSRKQTQLRMVSKDLVHFVYSTNNVTYPYVKEATAMKLIIDGKEIVDPLAQDGLYLNISRHGDIQIHCYLTGYIKPFSLRIIDRDTKITLSMANSSAGAAKPDINDVIRTKTVKTLDIRYRVDQCSSKTTINLHRKLVTSEIRVQGEEEDTGSPVFGITDHNFNSGLVELIVLMILIVAIIAFTCCVVWRRRQKKLPTSAPAEAAAAKGGVPIEFKCPLNSSMEQAWTSIVTKYPDIGFREKEGDGGGQGGSHEFTFKDKKVAGNVTLGSLVNNTKSKQPVEISATYEVKGNAVVVTLPPDFGETNKIMPFLKDTGSEASGSSSSTSVDASSSSEGSE